MTTKVCITCHVEKDINEFYERKNSKDGRRNNCIQCQKNLQEFVLQKNKEMNDKVDLSGNMMFNLFSITAQNIICYCITSKKWNK